MKFSVSTYSFSRLVESGKYTQFDLIALCKEMGFDGIEFTDLRTPEGMEKNEYAALLNETAKKNGLEIANYTIGANFLAKDGVEAEAERLMREVDTAKILGAKSMRHDATWGYDEPEKHYKSFDSALPLAAKGCRMVTEYAAGLGITTMVENHGQFCQESARVERLVNEVGSPNFGVLIDIGNFLCADDDPANAVGRLAPYAKHVHAKDFHFKSGNGPDPGRGFFTSRGGNYLRGAVIGHGCVPVKQCLDILKRSGYDGFISIEFEGVEDNLWAIETGLENLRNYSK